MILITEDCRILYSHYQTNNGQPLDIVVDKMKEIYALAGDRINIRASAVTGYGEDLIKAALKADFGIVETVAHFKAALHFNPKADFIIDIGGQDIKCFKVKNHAIDSIMLNEACSSGCGSFIQTFAKAMDMDIEEFSRLGLFAKHPVELGSRCTVFMNSSVKQAQKEGASIEDISAGLSSSIVKNAIYKVIRAKTPEELGENIVVQGGTFMNDAVLRSFEKETGKEVIRPAIAGLMGAFGAALYAKEAQPAYVATSSVLSAPELADFTYVSRASVCRGCTAKCNINIVTFADGRKYISGNKCERGVGKKPRSDDSDMLAYKYRRLQECVSAPDGGKKRGRVGIPFQLVMFEQLPLWAGFFEKLGFETVLSDKSSRELYFRGQHTVASDTACYPAKLMHGHIESLLDKGVDFIFYPCESYNLDEHDSTNHYNCPVVAYYPELLKANNERLNDENFVMPYIDPNMRASTVRNLRRALGRYKLGKRQIEEALDEGFARLDKYHADVRAKGREITERARAEGRQIVVLAGRPYHADPEINHGIGKLLTSLGFAVLSEDSVFEEAPPRQGERPQSMDVSCPSVPRGGIRFPAEGHESGAARFLRVRHRRDHDGRGARHSRKERKTVHADKNRRNQQPRRRPDTAAQHAGGDRGTECGKRVARGGSLCRGRRGGRRARGLKRTGKAYAGKSDTDERNGGLHRKLSEVHAGHEGDVYHSRPGHAPLAFRYHPPRGGKARL